MSDRVEDQTIAIAGIFQAAALTQALARDGKAPENSLQASVYSLLQIDAPDVRSVFGALVGIELGLTTLKTQLSDAHDRDIDITRYFIGLLRLAGKLAHDRRRQDQIRTDIIALKANKQPSDYNDVELTPKIANIYTKYISVLDPRIIVKGEALYLQNDSIAARIRTSLLGGIRAAHLWRQLRGRRWHLLSRRGQILRHTNRLLDHIGATSAMV